MRRRSKMRTRTKFVIISLVAVIIYTVAVLWLSYNDKTVPSELTVAFFAFFGSELALLAGIKIKDIDNNGN